MRASVACFFWAALYVLGTASARPLLLLEEAPQQGWESRGNKVQDAGQGIAGLLNWVNGQLDSVESLLDSVNAQSKAEEEPDSVAPTERDLQRQNAFRIQDSSPLDGFLQDVMQQLDGGGTQSSSAEGSNLQYSETTTEVTQTPEGILTREYVKYPRDGSGSSGSVYEQLSSPEDSGRVQTAFDAHFEDRMRQLEQMSAAGSISAAEADRLRRLFSSQDYVEAWAREQQRAEWQRNMALGQTLLQSMLLPLDQQQQQQQQEEGAFPGTVAEGGPLQDLLDLMLAPFQEEASGCRHRRQQQQQQQHMMMMAQQQQPEKQQEQQDEQNRDAEVSTAGPRVWVSFMHGSDGNDPSAQPVHRPFHGTLWGRPFRWSHLGDWLALLLTFFISFSLTFMGVSLVKKGLQLYRQRNELCAHLLSHEAARKVCGGGGFDGGIAGAKCLDGGKGAFLPPKATAYGKPDSKPEQQQQQQQQEQQGFVSNVVYAADHL